MSARKHVFAIMIMVISLHGSTSWAQIPLGSDLNDFQTPWTRLLADAPPRPMDVKAIAAGRKELIELLRQSKVVQ